MSSLWQTDSGCGRRSVHGLGTAVCLPPSRADTGGMKASIAIKSIFANGAGVERDGEAGVVIDAQHSICIQAKGRGKAVAGARTGRRRSHWDERVSGLKAGWPPSGAGHPSICRQIGTRTCAWVKIRESSSPSAGLKGTALLTRCEHRYRRHVARTRAICEPQGDAGWRRAGGAPSFLTTGPAVFPTTRQCAVRDPAATTCKPAS